MQVQGNLTWAARSTHIRKYEVNFKCSHFSYGARVRPCDCSEFLKDIPKLFPLHTKKNHIARILVEIKIGSWSSSCQGVTADLLYPIVWEAIRLLEAVWKCLKSGPLTMIIVCRLVRAS